MPTKAKIQNKARTKKLNLSLKKVYLPSDVRPGKYLLLKNNGEIAYIKDFNEISIPFWIQYNLFRDMSIFEIKAEELIKAINK